MFESVNLNNKHLNISVATHHFLQGYCPFPNWFLCLVHKIKKSKPSGQNPSPKDALKSLHTVLNTHPKLNQRNESAGQLITQKTNFN